MAATLLTERFAKIVHEHEMIFFGEIGARRLAKLIEAARRRVADVHGERMELENVAELIERHPLPRENGARQDRLGLVIKDVVLREDMVRQIFRGGWSRRVDSVQHHHHAGDAAIGLILLGFENDADREIGLERVSLEEKRLAFGRAKIDKRIRKR